MGSQRVAELFAQVRTRLAVTLALTLGLGCLLALFSTRRILAFEGEAGSRFREVTAARGELKELSARLVEAQENERRAIARELHDEVGQSLSAVLVGLSNLSAEIADQPVPVSSRRSKTCGGWPKAGCVAAVRNIALLLRPPMLDDLGPGAGFEMEGPRSGAPHRHSKSAWRPRRFPTICPTSTGPAFSGWCRKLCTTPRATPAPSHVRIQVRQEATGQISVQDDGPVLSRSLEKGVGILGMEERVTQPGRQFAVESAARQRARLCASIFPWTARNGARYERHSYPAGRRPHHDA